MGRIVRKEDGPMTAGRNLDTDRFFAHLRDHAAHPGVRAQRHPGCPRGPRDRRDPRLHRPGGGRRRGLRQSRPFRSPPLQPPRPRPYPRQGGGCRRHDARAVRPRRRRVRRQGRLDAHRRLRGGDARGERGGRSEHPHRGRRRPRGPAAPVARRGRPSRGVHLRRRGGESRSVPRGAQLGRGVPACRCSSSARTTASRRRPAPRR